MASVDRILPSNVVSVPSTAQMNVSGYDIASGGWRVVVQVEMYHLPLFANPRNGQYSALFVVCLNEFEGLFEGLRWDKMVLGCRVKQMLCSRSQCPVSTLWSWRGEQVICNRSILSIQCTTLFSAYTSS